MVVQIDTLAAQIARVAERQHGVIARRQLLAIGMNPSTISLWINSGHLHLLHRGVYAVGHRVVSQEGRWMAAVLACPDGSLLSHGAAGQLTGIIKRAERVACHVTVPAGSSASPDGVATHRTRSLDPIDSTKRIHIPTTTITRTVWDLATVLSPLQTRRAFEQAEKWRPFDRSRLRQLLDASPSRKGARVIGELLADRPLPLAETRSRLEELVLEICRDHSLPVPAVNVPLLGYEVDFLWPRQRFVVEADGGDHLTPTRRDSDNERDLALGRAGYLVRRYGWQAMNDREAVATEVRGILRERSQPDEL